MADMVLLLFSPIDANYIWYTDCCKVSRSYVMQTFNTPDMSLHIIYQKKDFFWQNQKSWHQVCPLLQILFASNIKSKFCLFLLNVFWTTITGSTNNSLFKFSPKVSEFLKLQQLLLVVEICPDLLSPAHVDVLLHLGGLQWCGGFHGDFEEHETSESNMLPF